MEFVQDDEGIRIVEEYNASIARKVTFIAGMLIILFAAICISCSMGGRHVDVLSIPGLIWDHINGTTYDYPSEIWWDDYIVCDVRLPRVLIACVAGATLAICGTAVQSLMNNPLASPYTLGMSSGADFGATMAIVMGFSMGTSLGIYGTTISAFIFGMVPVVVVLMISKFVRLSPVTLILIGIAISEFFGSMSTLVFIGADEGSVEAAYLWSIGDLLNVTWADFRLMAILMVIGSIILYAMSWKFNVLSLGEDSAKTMGVDVERFRILMMALLALMTMSVVAFVGIIGFVGLIAPHMVRYMIGSDNRFVIPGSMVLGAFILLAADSIARICTADAVPVGSVMALIGAPVFLYLIMRRNSQFKGAW